ncbi:hypothetical protein F5B19DRAFT_490321 [Rostrohypoxylon terebratum]|nr:hypothetical protein F5B19DRAFT_490321 [Rostrohypoxylon terebratum]
MAEAMDSKYPRVVARGDFQKTTPHQLSVRKGETLFVIFRGFEQWIFVKNEKKEEGFVDRDWVMEMLL